MAPKTPMENKSFQCSKEGRCRHDRQQGSTDSFSRHGLALVKPFLSVTDGPRALLARSDAARLRLWLKGLFWASHCWLANAFKNHISIILKEITYRHLQNTYQAPNAMLWTVCFHKSLCSSIPINSANTVSQHLLVD